MLLLSLCSLKKLSDKLVLSFYVYLSTFYLFDGDHHDDYYAVAVMMLTLPRTNTNTNYTSLSLAFYSGNKAIIIVAKAKSKEKVAYTRHMSVREAKFFVSS